MGIPAFYRWLIERFPRSVVDVLEDSSPVVNGVRLPVDITRSNPNGVEFDNLYLDMNGIIHPCFHPENGSPPKSYDEVFAAVFKYIDRIFALVRPRKLLFMAIDGVAPRAKMNQQRARRFRAAKDAADMASLLEKQGSDHEEKDKPAESGVLDSNLITPGTGFMESLSSALQYYVHLRINNDPGWKGVKVILSDATVPGEGEHKVMSYIRLQRNLPGFDPNTRHCLYGLDADLIMLALATHEVHFSVLREDVRRPPPDSKDHKAHNMKKAAGKTYLEPKEVPSQYLEDIISKQKFQFLNVWVLRDYLAESLRVPDPTVKFDLERLIDDFVFMCLFVGNDFLPHVPSLEISEGAIDLLMSVYKKEFVRMGGYLTNATEVNLKGVEHFVQTLGSHENAIFKKRQQEQLNWEHRARRFPAKSNLQSDATFVADKVNLGEDGWKERYYTEKFEAQSDDDRETVKKDAVLKYVEGICWVMHYYYQGVCSWQWFYPYHYAPFGSDFRDLDQLDIHFELGKPFKPFDQLMGVLPAASAGALPLCYRKLMTDQASPILDLYPTEFDLDLNGRKQAWKAICKLPFIDEARLLSEIAKVENTLTDVERRRNTLGVDQLFINISHPLAAKILTFWERNKDHPKLQRAKVRTLINPRFSDGMNGYVYISDKPICPPEIPSPLHDMKTITPNKVLLVFYKLPDLHPHIPRPPEGVRMPKKVIGKHDLLPPPTLWHQSAVSQSRFSTRPVPPKSIAGSSLAEICHSLVAKTYSSEDRGNAMKRSHDAAMNHSGKKRKRRGGKSKKRNA
ncbi:5'-3' exoribonuclease 3-like isoform X1 [Salvia hispanica]|uniref:5'-3' exoribonuclease 3-like isoform X1 n=2 Tax=Salvia hispanica TaxID=49212 RepID=UPI0020094405|nr:5'-3' exoribonuclease 3-like isoform X1 [Salvia hispanica]